MKKRILCIKDVVMDDSGEVAFTEGKSYEIDLDSSYLSAINNQEEEHCLGTMHDEDRWFQKHFEIVE
ncbi:hypothetical protein Kirov_240 [Bacillus phage Kirov]|uniref:Uncharacterized protein n=1 Tax=Bacillus phage Kirov TaxID=2783539 RepID=A0A7U3NK12_9CAUD|nr:hypothetical protein PQE67_gp064 [Bacillus phage Kirov]QOV08439.1 hypothetical protein Kirov_240 [Bacillus phage Kirov]